MNFSEYHSVLAILSLIKGAIVPITQEPIEDTRNICDRTVQRIMESMYDAHVCYDSHMEEAQRHGRTFPIEAGELTYATTVRLQLNRSISILIFHIGVRTADNYFWADVLEYNPHVEGGGYKRGFCEELC